LRAILVRTEEDDLFQVVVESKATSAAFEIPDGWRHEAIIEGSLSVEILTPPPTDGVSAPRAPIVTFHDVGMNAPLCFSSFFSYCRTTRTCPELDTAAAQYHITVAGHSADSPTTDSAADSNSSISYEVLDLAANVVRVLDRLELRRVVGFGFGIGATILSQAALLATRGRFAGLIMVSPVFYAASLWERTFISVDSTIFSAGMGLGRRGKDRFIERWLGPETKDYNHDLISHLEAELDRLSSANVGRFLAAEGRRPDLSLQLADLKHTKVMLITGRESPLRFHVEEGFSKFDPKNVTWLDVMDIGSFIS